MLQKKCPNERDQLVRKGFLIAFAIAVIVAALVVGFYYWKPLTVVALAFIVWTKKLFTLSGLLLILKKLPFLIIGGGKKIFIKVMGGLLLYSARIRFRFIRKIIVNLKLAARYFNRKLLFHWEDMALWEKIIVWVASIPLTLVIMVILLMLVGIPAALRSFAIRKAQESTAAGVINKMVPEKTQDKISGLHEKVKTTIKGGTDKKSSED